MSDLPKFDSNATCPKCGETNIHARWLAAESLRSRYTCSLREEREHVHRYCRRCGFEWDEAPYGFGAYAEARMAAPALGMTPTEGVAHGDACLHPRDLLIDKLNLVLFENTELREEVARLRAAPPAPRTGEAPRSSSGETTARCPHGDPRCMCQAPMDPGPAPSRDAGTACRICAEWRESAAGVGTCDATDAVTHEGDSCEGYRARRAARSGGGEGRS